MTNRLFAMDNRSFYKPKFDKIEIKRAFYMKMFVFCCIMV